MNFERSMDMKNYLLFLLVMVTACTNTPENEPVTLNTQHTSLGFAGEDSLVVVTTVQEFFKAFDERDLGKMTNILDPAMKIIHHNGSTTNREEIITIIKETKNWWPRTRKLSDFECIGSADMAIVSLYNEVIFSLPKNKKVIEPYRETWIFEKIENRWKPVRCHYSKVTVSKHSEEVE